MLRHWLSLPLLIPCAVVLGAATTLWGHLEAQRTQDEVMHLRAEEHAAENLLAAATRTDLAIRGYLLYSQFSYLEDAHRELARIEAPEARAAVANIDAVLGPGREGSLTDALAAWTAQRRRALAMVTEGQGWRVFEAGQAGMGQALMTEVRSHVDDFLASTRRTLHERKRALESALALVLGLVLTSAALSLGALFASWRQLRERHRAELQSHAALARSGQELEVLRETSELLQACDSAEEVCAVASEAVARLLPGSAVAIHLASEEDAEVLTRVATRGGLETLVELDRAACWALKRGRPHGCESGMMCSNCAHSAASHCVPLMARGETLGVMLLAGILHGDDHARLANTFADATAMSLGAIRLREQLRLQALRDPLTGLNNRRFLDEIGDRLAAQTMRRGGQLSVIMLDLDHFKGLNDTHGHAAGDAALRRAGQVIAEGLRRSDICCRYGGEEFALVLADCSLENAAIRAEHLRRRLAREPDAHGVPPVTASMGVAALPMHGTSLNDLLAAADAALYRAKANGRNRVETATATGAPPLRLAPETAGTTSAA